MASQDTRLSKFEADFKQQQSEMTNKINTVLKAITDRMAEALLSDTVKNPKLNVNSTSPVLSAQVKKEEEPKDTLQKGSNGPTIINELESDGIKEEKELEWLDIKEPLDLVDTYEESVYESLIKEIPREVTFKTPFKDSERSELTSDCHDLVSSRIILSEDDYDRGCERPSDLESGLYKDVDKLGPEYQPGPEESNSRSEVNNKGEVNKDSSLATRLVIFDEKKLGSSLEVSLDDKR
ncbi:hypothetical protein Tco_0928615 [Tanacetum coccineum]